PAADNASLLRAKWRTIWRWRAAGAAVAALGLAVVFVHEISRRARLDAPRPTLILSDRNGAFLTQIGNASPSTAKNTPRLDYGYWPLERLPERIVRATLALEDHRFWSHPGVDPIAVARALWHRLHGTHRSGASTIAMQVARMQQPARRTLWRKAVEAGTAVALTWRYGRTALLAHYLRLVPYGNGSHGITHAARWYFDKPVDDLSWAEIALLAATPQSPTRLNPLRRAGLERAMRRGHRILDALAHQGVIDGAELALAHRQLQGMLPLAAPRRPDALHAVLHYETMAKAGR